MSQQLDIGEVVSRTGLPPSTLHYWEKQQLIAPVGRDGLRRQYDPEVIRRIAVIVACQQSGFTVDEIRQVLDPSAFDAGKQLLQAKYTELVDRRAALDRAIGGLEHALGCDAPSPLLCNGFWKSIGNILPVQTAANARQDPG